MLIPYATVTTEAHNNAQVWHDWPAGRYTCFLLAISAGAVTIYWYGTEPPAREWYIHIDDAI